jgi:lauroyl/myristoyl acyltransferase
VNALDRLRLAPDGRPRPGAPFGRGPMAARVLARVIAAASAAGARLDPATSHRLAAVGGTLEWAARPGKRRVLRENLAHFLGLAEDDPALDRLVREEIRNEARRSADLLWAIARPQELIANTRLDGRERLDAVFAQGRGVVIAGPHVGGWEVAVPVPAAVLPVPASALVTDDWLAWAVDRIRRRVRLGVVYTGEGPLEVARRLRRGEALIMFSDIAPPGVATAPVRLGAGVVELPLGPATLARLGGAPIVPMAVLPMGPRAWRVELGAAIEPAPRQAGQAGDAEVLQRLADAWSAVIRRHPEQWAAVYPLRWRLPAPPGCWATPA